ncbi:MAG: glycosyltransferase family 4 protein [Candidatus Aenigmatarchaeota archaeon]
MIDIYKHAFSLDTVGLHRFYNLLGKIISEEFESNVYEIYFIDNIYADLDTLVLHLSPQFSLLCRDIKAEYKAIFPVIDFLNPRPFWRDNLEKFNILLSFSTFVDIGCNQLGFPSTHKLYYPVYPSGHNFAKKVEKESKFTFLTIENAHWRKGTKDLITAFEKIFSNNKDVQLIIRSAGPFPKHQVELLNSIHAPNIIPIFDGYFGRCDISDLFLKSHCYVSNTRGEMLGLTMFEAVEAGLPVIAPMGTKDIPLPFYEYIGIQPSILYTIGKYQEIGLQPGFFEISNSIGFFTDMDNLSDSLYEMYKNYEKYTNIAPAYQKLKQFNKEQFIQKFYQIIGGYNENIVYWRKPIYAHSDGNGQSIRKID